MQSPILITTLLAATLASAAISPPNIGIPPSPSSPSSIPACGSVTDYAILGAQSAARQALKPFGYPELEDAIDAGTACFKRVIGCGENSSSSSIPEATTTAGAEGERDCSGVVDKALTTAVAVLKRGFGFMAPVGYDEGVEEGVKCFRQTLRCKQV